ncbi:MAG: hypothetical protein QOJ78_2701 [Pseudonocardiales bacterium]|nr:hypothetical protein [Pseudonocardiales bacterium]
MGDARGVVRGFGLGLGLGFGVTDGLELTAAGEADVDALAGVVALAGGRGLVAEPEQPAAARESRTSETKSLLRRAIAPGCHVTPMRIRGWVEGVSQRMIEMSLVCEIATQPAVARPSVTCRKNALPLPAFTPPGALRVL